MVDMHVSVYIMGCLGLQRSRFFSSTPAPCCQTPSTLRTPLHKKDRARGELHVFLKHLKGYSNF
jgi:hypothetical protein